MLGHALELLRQLGDFDLAAGQAGADRGGEERRQGRRAAQQAHEAIGRQAPDDALGDGGEGGGARLVAQQGQVAEDGRWLEDVEAGAVGAALDQAAAQDVQGIGGRALLEDHLAWRGVDLLEGGGESGAVDRCELGEGRDRRELGGGFGDGLAGAVGNGQAAQMIAEITDLNSGASGAQGGLAAVGEQHPGLDDADQTVGQGVLPRGEARAVLPHAAIVSS